MPRKPVTAIIVQARLGSSRLPGKILQKIGGRTVLEHDIARLKSVRGADLVVIATTDKDSDTVVADAATAAGALVFRGDETDVLARYLGAARMVDADVVMRVTSDCPLIDSAICDAVLALRAATGADYAANNMPRLFPHGLDCEAFTRAALERAANEATDAYDREHVTPWLRRMPGLTRANLTGPGWPANQQRWTLDFPEDLTFFADLFAEMPLDPVPDWQAVLSYLGQHPQLVQANARHRAGSPMASDADAPVAVFRFEANARIGSGHAMRCNTLQARLEALGWRCYWAIDSASAQFLAASVPPGALIELHSVGPAETAGEIAAAAGSCDLLVIDHYGIDVAFAAAMRPYANRIVYIDDLADRQIDADVVINSTPNFTPRQYAPLTRGMARCLLGPDFALLRQQFLATRAKRPQPSTGAISKVLIAFGGVDPLDGSSLALEAVMARPSLTATVVLGSGAPYLGHVTHLAAAHPGRVRVLTDLADMAGCLAAADLVIGAPGTSTWERCSLGLPSILIGIADNQRANAAIVKERGAGLIAGFLTDTARPIVAEELGRQIDRLMAEPALLSGLGEAAATLCDGRGVQRVIAALVQRQELKNGLSLELRLAEATDEQSLLDWQSAPETRRYALTPKIPTPAEHHDWLQKKLASDRDWFLIGEVAGAPVGFVRLDWMGEDKGRPQYLISIATAPGHYGKGIGSALLKAARNLAPGGHFYAKVLAENVASMALFTSADYVLAADGYFHSDPARRKEA
ncbi:UDP-2,4-diacetamido-2,4,6-trideoxy-beta-L-altropyranose hydrolase [Dongia rigui]|uniref:UDP-2,4-diacetamido-2,4, 6-trideoxy-beta-L-altropyranose hydrolase n=1 Tax=Dongia rigui TaxID=940149 RepID=A0ABU5E1I6_9PROT|nr:UDP-2,4-diacetamido-2,4,6-trideoxy-beta-L-altropyranose hydrolase [Dongia rigui]MDY0873065.1 UDP-2,4-diacetamido-2,4,6-trideoxy-beta-L-altropyranose hydrolase [Dongia rigui]